MAPPTMIQAPISPRSSRDTTTVKAMPTMRNAPTPWMQPHPGRRSSPTARTPGRHRPPQSVEDHESVARPRCCPRAVPACTARPEWPDLQRRGERRCRSGAKPPTRLRRQHDRQTARGPLRISGTEVNVTTMVSSSTRPNGRRARLTRQGQITVPKAIRDALGLRPGDELEFVPRGSELLVEARPRRSVLEFAGIATPDARVPATAEELDALIADGMRDAALARERRASRSPRPPT